MIKDILRLIRPKQWIKNMFVFIPMFFAGELFDLHSLCLCAVTFLAYSLMASSIYCYNDIVDADADRRHPVKCHRPVASGAVSVRLAYTLMALMAVLSVAVVLLLPPEVMANVLAVVLFYYLLNLSFLLTLFMSFAKRRDDVLRMNETGEPPRKNTVRYNLTFINQAITITASVTLVCYIMYTVSPEVTERFDTPYLYLTFVFVLLGLLRYIQIAVVDKKSGDPTKVILHDHFSQMIVVAWVLSFLLMIYVI